MAGSTILGHKRISGAALAVCMLATGLATASSVAAAPLLPEPSSEVHQSEDQPQMIEVVALNSLQSPTDWYVNDDPVFIFGTEWSSDGFYPGYSSDTAHGPRRADAPYGGSNYVFMLARGGESCDNNWAFWPLGERTGYQQVSVYLPESPDATVTYHVSNEAGNIDYPVRISQADHEGWTNLGEFYFDNTEVYVSVYDCEAAEHHETSALRDASIGIDAARIRCVRECGTAVPGVPSGVRFSSGQAVWNEVSDATAYDLEFTSDDGGILISFKSVRCCEFRITDTTVDSVRVRAVNNAGHSDWSDWIEDPVAEPGVPSGVRYSSGWAVWDEVPGAYGYDVSMWDGTSETVDELQCCQHWLPSGVTHFRVRAGTLTSDGDWSDWVEVPATVPGVPSGVRFSSGQAVWNEVSDATAYDLEFTSDDGGILISFKSVRCCEFRITDTTVDSVRVRAVNSAGHSDWSDWAEAPVAVPDAPTGVRYSSGQAVWNAVSEADSYDLELSYRSAGEAVSSGHACCSVTIDSQNVGEFRVRASNAAQVGPWSRWIRVPEPESSPEVEPPPGEISDLEFRDGSVHWSELDVASRYQVQWRYDDGASTTSTISCTQRCSFALALVQGKTLQYRVRAGNDHGWGPWSSWGELTPISTERLSAPGVVSGLEYRSGRAVWSAVPGANSYEVELWDDDSEVVSGVDCCQYRLDGGEDAIDDDQYRVTRFRVRAVNDIGQGPWSQWVNDPTAVVKPGSVTGVAFGNDTIVWQPVPGATSYTIRLWDGRQARNIEGVTCCRYGVNPATGASFFTITAINSAGNGPWAQWTRTWTAPSAVENLRVVAEGSDDPRSPRGRLRVTWSPPVGDGNSSVTGYTITISRPGWTSEPFSRSPRSRSFVLHPLRADTTYTVRVVATNRIGSSLATVQSVTTPATPSVPRNVVVEFEQHPNRLLSVSWDPPARDGGDSITGYTIMVTRPGARVPFGPYDRSASSRNYDFLSPRWDTTYTIRVVARNGFGSSSEIVKSIATPSPKICPTRNKFDTVGGGGLSSTRIKSLQDFETIHGDRIKKGDLGGIVSGKHNLEQSGCSWIHYHAVVKGRAKVAGDAVVGEPSIGESSIGLEVSGSARIYGRAHIFGANTRVFGSAEVYGMASVHGGADVYGESQVYGEAEVFGPDARVFNSAHVFGNVAVSDRSEVYGNASVSGNVMIMDDADVRGEARIDTEKGGKVEIRDTAKVGSPACPWVDEVRSRCPRRYHTTIRAEDDGIVIISDDAYVHEGAQVIATSSRNSLRPHETRISDRAEVRGKATVYENSIFEDDIAADTGTFNGEEEYRDAARRLYEKLFKSMMDDFQDCNERERHNWDDEFIRTNVHYLLSDDAYLRGQADALVYGCARLEVQQELIRVNNEQWWDLLFSYALGVVGSIRLGLYLKSLVKLAELLEIVNASLELNESSRVVGAVKRTMREFEACDIDSCGP